MTKSNIVQEKRICDLKCISVKQLDGKLFKVEFSENNVETTSEFAENSKYNAGGEYCNFAGDENCKY